MPSSKTSSLLSPRRRRSRKVRTQRILDTAVRLLVEEGAEALTINGLARELGYVPGALYRYFDSRDHLLAEIQRLVFSHALESFQEGYEALEAELAERDGAVDAALARVFAISDHFLTFARSYPHKFGFLTSQWGDPRFLEEDAARNALAAGRPILELAAEHLAHAVDADVLQAGDSFERAVILWGSLQGLLQLRKVGRVMPELSDVRRLVYDLTESLLIGWGAEQAAVSHVRDLYRAISRIPETTRS